MYGADVSGTLMKPGTDWNLAELDTCLEKGLDAETTIPGVTDPYLYFGAWKTIFGWHKEDFDLYSINFLHHGASKFWYSIDLDQNVEFE